MTANSLALFPGQGSQHVGMAKDLYTQFALAREIFEEASDAIGVKLSRLCFEGPDSDLTLTENTQPCLLVASVAAFRVAQKETGYTPAFVAGHSLGEYSALVAAGSLSLPTATRWVKERGKAMQQAVPAGQGTMAAILGLEDELVRKLCLAATESAKSKRARGETPPALTDLNGELTVEAVVEPANFNAPGQVVIAGSTDAVAEAVAMIKAGGDFPGGKAIPLSVSAPFHCRLMAPARDRMAELFTLATAENRPQPLLCPYVPNRTARPTRETGLVFEMLVEQVDHPVLWKQTIENLLSSGITAAVEFGPGKVLQGLVKRIAQPLGKVPPLLPMGESSHLKGLESLRHPAVSA